MSMPELAEVEHARRYWNPALGERITDVFIASPTPRVFRGTDRDALVGALVGSTFTGSEARGKQLAFRFGDAWLGLHLGMSGALVLEDARYIPRKHDHLVVRTANHSMVFNDPRHFGRVLFHEGPDEPAWWSKLAPSVLSDAFTADELTTFLKRRGRSPLKAALLMQERFPGVGNWMADEILWRVKMHPATLCGALGAESVAALWRGVRRVARLSIDTIDDDWNYPDTWLFSHRWEPGGHCPRCDAPLSRDAIGGRTTCWCPRCQGARALRRLP